MSKGQYKLFTWGSGSNGTLGHGDYEDLMLPKEVSGIDESNLRKQPSYNIGGCHALLCAYQESTVLQWGGDGLWVNHPINVETTDVIRSNVGAVCSTSVGATGWSHSLLAFNSDDRDAIIVSWGFNGNRYGELGREFDVDIDKRRKNESTSTSYSALAPIVNFPCLKKVISISCGRRTSAAVVITKSSTSSYNVFTWGSSRHGALAHGKDVLSVMHPQCVSSLSAACIDSVYCGLDFTVFMSLASNKVYTTGINKYGQLGYHPNLLKKSFDPLLVEFGETFNVQAVAVGWTHVLVLVLHEDCNKVLSFGRNNYGQLGIGSFDVSFAENNYNEVILPDICFINVDEKKNIKEKAGGVLNRRTTTSIPPRISSDIVSLPKPYVIQIYCGSEHSGLVLSNGTLYTWGWGEHGNLGHDDTLNIHTPKRVDFLYNKQLYVVSAAFGGAVSSVICQDQET